MSPRAAFFLTLAWVVSTHACAHEFWITPSTYAPQPAAPLELQLYVGEFYTGDRVGVTTSHAASARLHSQSSSAVDLIGRFPASGMLPALPLTLPAAGTYVFAYDSHPSEVVLSGDKFHAYLHEEGLDGVIRLREARGDADKPARERFRRHAKVLLRAGGKSDATYKVRAGQRMEIVPSSDPLNTRTGERSSWQVLFDGKGLEGVLVKAWHKTASQVSVLRARTDANGLVTFTLPFPGPWLLNSVHMIAGDGRVADWESHWSSFTFELGRK